MKRKQLFPLILVSLAFLIVIGVNNNAYSQDNGYSLMVQQSPAEGGTVSPDLGIHRMSIDESVTLRATPKPGYRFVYWMGDVSSVSSTQTQVVINAPKIVVAVFEKMNHENDTLPAGVGRNSGGGGSANTNTNSSGQEAQFVSGGESRVSYTPGGGGVVGYLTRINVETGNGRGVSTGGGVTANNKAGSTGGYILVSTAPEPATIALLGGGALMLLRRRRR